MKNQEKILLYVVFVLTAILVGVMIFSKKSKTDEDKTSNQVISFPEELLDITYQEYKDGEYEYACITFYKDNKYSLYDCDSEPTNYPFDSEWECEPKYDGKKITFECLDNKKVTIDIVKWDKEEFVFKYNGEEHTFKITKEE